MKSLQWLLAGLFLLALASTLAAQNVPAPAPVAQGGVVGGGTISLSVISGPGVAFPGRAVKGVPFSADIVHEFTHTLADGNRIHRETHGAIFRDAEGRTRNESEPETLGFEMQRRITIMDPVAGTLTTLYPKSKMATVNQWHVPSPAPAAAGGADQTPTELLEKLKASRAEKVAEANRTNPRLHIEHLGAKEIEGFMAAGTRHTHTLEAGAVGNENPITTTTETWFCEDLKMTILNMSDDPRSGQRVMRLTNIRTGNPDPQLFQIPADYTVKDVPAREAGTLKP
jgi:hypothetical protein